MKKTAWAVIIADGKDQELMPGTDTAFLGVGIRPVIGHVLVAFEACPDIEGVVVVAPRNRVDSVHALSLRFGCSRLKAVTPGAPHRRACLAAGLALVDEEAEWIVVHDVSRPCITPGMISRVLDAAFKSGCAITAEPVADRLKLAQKKSTKVARTWNEGDLWVAQSPQAFRRSVLEKALAMARKKNLTFDEESEAVELIKGDVRLVPPERVNLRIRRPDDLALAAPLLM